ncbi:MAG TPA: DUF3300 domain-containing protein [Candidatus Kryptonia bacterium]|nr:DUF3300 domain-containing protein [Candidatus Kryptonia bacterium]
MDRTPKPLAALLSALLLLQNVPLLLAQEPAAAGATQAASAPAAPVFKPEEIDQVVAPVALYPDALLAQVLMASTYPLEIVQAARWAKENPNLEETALQDALQQQPWDPSVKSLCAFPQVLTMMNEKLDWTQKLGDAFLAQQKDVMDAVQRLRAKAQAEGNLKSNEQQKVTVEPAPVTVQQNVTVQQPAAAEQPAAQAAPAQTTVIKIEQANPQVVYVPTYSPTVYGPWPYPAYPPYYYYPPGYVATTSLLSFGAGMAVGAALWGDCNWGHGDVNINTNNYNNFNKTNISNGNWQHNVDHRKGVQYRDQGTRQKYNPASTRQNQSRDAFRGRAEQGRQQIARGETRDLQRGGAGARDRGASQTGRDRPGATQRDAGRAATQKSQTQRASAPTRQPSAYGGVGNGQQARADSDRGRSSRQSAAASSGSGRMGGASAGRAGAGGGGRGRSGGGRSGGGGGRRR